MTPRVSRWTGKSHFNEAMSAATGRRLLQVGTYLLGDEALDVARLTGIGLHSPRHGLHEAGDISPAAVDRARGLGYSVNVFIDLSRLDYVNQCKVAAARIGGHYYVDTEGRGNPLPAKKKEAV